MTTTKLTRVQHFKHWCNVKRLRLAIWLFPSKGWGAVANRTFMTFTGTRAEAMLQIRYLDKPDGYEWAEFIQMLGTFIGRKVTPAEWNMIMKWKNDNASA